MKENHVGCIVVQIGAAIGITFWKFALLPFVAEIHVQSPLHWVKVLSFVLSLVAGAYGTAYLYMLISSYTNRRGKARQRNEKCSTDD